MIRIFKSLNITDAVLGAVAGLLLGMNAYFLYWPGTSVARSRGIEKSIDKVRDEIEACEDAINKSFGKTLLWYRDDNGEFHCTYWD